MSTLRVMGWAFSLKGVSPVERLVAIYFANRSGVLDANDAMGMHIDVADLAEWCGCDKEEAAAAIGALRAYGLNSECFASGRYSVSFGGEPPKASSTRDAKGDEPLHLYVISTSKAVKVGISTNPKARFRGMRTAMPDDFKVDLLAQGPRRLISVAETRCHGDLQMHHLTGEWFSCSPQVAVEVARAILEELGIQTT